jgi:hypothetical protein
MSKILIATTAVAAIVAFNFAPVLAQARSCARVMVEAHGATQGIATRKADRRLDRYITRDVSGARMGHASTSCKGWGAGGLRPTCTRSAIVCGEIAQTEAR